MTAEMAGVEVRGPQVERAEEVLTPRALAFVAELHRRFDAERRRLLERRSARQVELDAGARLGFLPETEEVRAGDWRVAPPPPGRQDRRV